MIFTVLIEVIDMNRSSGRGTAPTRALFALLTLAVIATCRGGPLGNLQNATSADVGIIEGSCALGDVVYMPGDEFPGSSPCEKCSCTAGSVQCARQPCDPRPGCKALHRPDHCCPTYQCECEQEGRVYGNGEKLVDPADPCRVCYCQGGEVVCRRIACFVRDDCQPRLVPGRCCPEYDNCPLRGVTTAPGAAPSTSSVGPTEDVGTSVILSTQKENIKQEITIKEITPVSEIPVITEVKIKEILPSHGIDVAEYSSSKAPLIPREATTDRSISKEDMPKIDTPVVIEVTSSSTYSPISSSFPSAKPNLDVQVVKEGNSQPSKINLSTQDTNNGEVYSSNIPIVVTMGSYSTASERAPIVIVTRSPIMEEEEPVEHNPAFPPLPDDLSVLSNHDDEINSEQNIDMHLSGGDEVVVASTEAQTTKQTITTSTSKVYDIISTIKSSPTETPRTTDNVKMDTPISEETLYSNSSPTLNLRSAIPTEILNAATGDVNIALETAESTTNAPTTNLDSRKLEQPAVIGSKLTESEKKIVTLDTNISGVTDFDTSTHETSRTTNIASKPQEQTTSSIAKSNVATEVTLQTELSSLPIETSDQNPHETIDNLKEKISSPSIQVNVYTDTTTVKTAVAETVTDRPSINRDTKLYDNIETTEFILTSFGSLETATDAVELIKISPETEEKAAIIEPAEKHQNVLTDLINLVGDVASISDQTDEPSTQHVTITTGIAESEELIPVNAGYKSKNKNYNQNTITESAMKNKNSAQVNKQKVVEIEDDDFTITDPPAPNDKAEPTTKRPIIDHVSDDVPENKTEKKDIEIINKSYVATVNRRPTKVVMKKNHEKPLPDNISTEAVTSHSATELLSLGEDLVTGTTNVPNESSEVINVSTKASTSSIMP